MKVNVCKWYANRFIVEYIEECISEMCKINFAEKSPPGIPEYFVYIKNKLEISNCLNIGVLLLKNTVTFI